MISKNVIFSDIIRNASMVTIAVTQLAGCATTAYDEKLYSRNSPVALQMAEAQFQSKMDCKEAKGTILSQEIVQDRSFRDVTQFKINVKGCGKEAVYVIRCDDNKNPFCEFETP